MRCNKHYHVIDLPNGRQVRTRKDCNLEDVLGDDDELGFSLGKFLKKAIKTVGPAALGTLLGGPGLGTAIGASIGALAGSKKGRKKGRKLLSKGIKIAAPLAILPQGITPAEVPQGYHPAIRDDIKSQVLNALSHVSNTQYEQELTAKDIASHVTPSLDRIINILAQKKLQDQATSEHKRIVRDSARWNSSQQGQDKILAKIADLEGKIALKQKANATVSAAFGIPDKHI